ncbi:MAG: Gfo/Idh/MocA family oxidoreductase [Halanaerobiales bacterium]|nr:Gfo/Idh/MocA family oxidoreductase [Halanaerobiales bacterium]
MKVAVIGAGTMGSVHLGCYKKIEDIEVILCEIDDKKGKEVSELYNINWTKDYEEILNSDVDFIDVCLPTYLHEEYVIKAARAGKHVFCEKPIAISEESARNMVNECKKNGVKLGIGMVLRFFPEYNALKKRYEEGIIGKAGVINAFRGGGGHPSGWNDWYSDDNASRSLVVDLLIHDVDFIQSVFGDIEKVYANRKNSFVQDKKARYEIYSTIFQLENGIIVNLDGSWYDEGRFYTKFEVAGVDGIISINPELSTPIKTKVFDTESKGADVAVPESPLCKIPYQLELEDFIEAVKEDRNPAVSVEDAIKALKVTLKMYQSAREGRVLLVKEGE